jgi:amino acid adenylation domain-containing protein
VARARKFNCVVIGEGTLPVRCAEILLASGHEICSIVSSDTEVTRWSREKKIPHLEPGASLSEQLSRQPFDYLFSIVNERILRKDVLRLPRKLAINYHDSLLPRYAGTHATSWALINSEHSHGITWHVITNVVDAGDILKQQHVQIAGHDTAFALNTKCYEAAINSFIQLVQELSTGSVAAKRQNLDERLFVARYKRPANGCVISWNSRAADISALVRALNFGTYPNPIGSPKLALENDFVIIPGLEVLPAPAPTPPGTINQISPDCLRISTADREVVLRQALTLYGESISIPALAARFRLKEGHRFTDLDSKTARRLEALYATSCLHEEFWLKKLTAVQPAVLPYTRSAASGDVARYATLKMRIPDEVFAFLEDRQAELSAGDVLLAAYGALLARLGGVVSFDIGYKYSELQRKIAGLESFFATQLPLRINVDCLQTFTGLLKAVKEEVGSVNKHEIYGRDLVARYPQLRRATHSGNKFTLPVTVERVKRLADHATPGSQITLLISETELECHWIYDREKLEDESVRQIVRHFATLLKGLAANPECQTGRLPLLTGGEQRQLLVEWNNNRSDYPKDECIHQLFEARADQTPEAVAVMFEDGQLTYGELDSRANQLAHVLIKRGVGPETFVAVCFDRSPNLLVTLLAILKAGGAYVPLDPGYPRAHLQDMLEDSRAALLLTQKALVQNLPTNVVEVICVDELSAKTANESQINPGIEISPENLAYVMFTSGSTGRPKGVAVTHRNVVRLVRNTKYASFSADEVFLQFAPISFDASTFEVWGSLLNGARLALMPAGTASLKELGRALKWYRVTTLWLTAGLFRLMIDNHLDDLRGLRQLLAGGDVLSVAHVQKVLEELHGCCLINGYGPTENTTFTCCYPVTDPAKINSSVPIGYPISNTSVYILDRDLNPTPIGVPGELYIGGDGLARGYLHWPALTAERFVPNPFSLSGGSRLYRTGDLVRYRAAGEIEFLGRIDNQVKVRGFRIELGEVEAALENHPSVCEAVVVARKDEVDKHLIAYLVLNETEKPSIDELRDFLKQRLPDHMVPAFFMSLEKFPLTSNGKIDRCALPLPEMSHSDSGGAFVAPRSETEKRVAAMWGDVLRREEIGIYDNFFDLGGNSLLATQVVSRVRDVFQQEFPVRSLFEYPRLEEFGRLIDNNGHAENNVHSPAIVPMTRDANVFEVHGGSNSRGTNSTGRK